MAFFKGKTDHSPSLAARDEPLTRYDHDRYKSYPPRNPTVPAPNKTRRIISRWGGFARLTRRRRSRRRGRGARRGRQSGSLRRSGGCGCPRTQRAPTGSPATAAPPGSPLTSGRTSAHIAHRPTPASQTPVGRAGGRALSFLGGPQAKPAAGERDISDG
eukprot:1184750-Prorocentrum_minimum.AAC.1